MSRCAQDTVNARSMNIRDFRVAGDLWPVGRPSKLGMGHFWADFSVKVDPSGGLGGPISKHGFPGMGPFVNGAVCLCGECHAVSNSCYLRVVRCVFDRHDAASVLLERNRFGDLLDVHASGCHLLDGEKFLCGTDHSRGENTCKHLGFGTTDDVVHGFGVLCMVLCRCAMWENLLFCCTCYGEEGEEGSWARIFIKNNSN